MYRFPQHHFHGRTLFFVLVFLLPVQTYAGSIPKSKHQNQHDLIHLPTLSQLVAPNNISQITDFEARQLPDHHRAKITKFETLAEGSYLIQQVVQLWLANYWRSQYRYTYIYNANGDITEKTQEFWQSSAWENFGKRVYTFRSPGKIETFLEQHWESSAWVNIQRATNFYDSTLLLTSTLWERWNQPDWIYEEQDIYTYDELNRMIDYTVQRWVGDTWQNDLRYSYSYDNNMLTQILSLTWNNNAWTNIERQTATYENGLKKQVFIEMPAWWTSGWVPRYLHTYSYEATHLLDNYLLQEWISGQWENVWDESYTYNANNNKTETLQRGWNGTSWNNINKLLSSFASNNTETEFLWQRWDAARSTSGSMASAESAWVNYQRIENTYSATTSIDEKGPVARSFHLYDNYPNPFNPGTEVRFEISGLGFVSLKIYDVLGKEIATLVNEKLPAGSYRRRWDANGLPGGVYFYRLQSGSDTAIKKMVLLK